MVAPGECGHSFLRLPFAGVPVPGVDFLPPAAGPGLGVGMATPLSGSLAPWSYSLPRTHHLNLHAGCPASQTTNASRTEVWLTRDPLCPSLELSAFFGDFLSFSHGNKSQELSNQEEQVKGLPRGDSRGRRVGKAHSM